MKAMCGISTGLFSVLLRCRVYVVRERPKCGRALFDRFVTALEEKRPADWVPPSSCKENMLKDYVGGLFEGHVSWYLLSSFCHSLGK